MVQEFKVAPWDTTVKVMTMFVIGTGVAVMIMFIVIGLVTDDLIFFPLIGFLSLALVVAVAYPYAPQSYVLNDKEITIKRLFLIRIPYKDIVAVEAVERVKIGIRTGGIGGVFGYIGFFMVEDTDGKYKTSKLYLTRRDHIVRIRTNKTIYYLSPAEPEIFIDALKSRLKEGKKVEL